MKNPRLALRDLQGAYLNMISIEAQRLQRDQEEMKRRSAEEAKRLRERRAVRR